MSLVRNNQDIDFNIHNLTNINSITLKTQAADDIQVITQADVEQFHKDNETNKRDLGKYFYEESNVLVKNNQDKDFDDNKLTNKYSITINGHPTLDTEVSNKKYIDDELDKVLF